jgi:demethylmenaquinone methyltransferase / 2-methoxy-6-polyprenyl-1,4-benzoquinol methylase
MNKSIQKMFEPLAERYELVNHVFTFGLDTVWRKKAARIATGETKTRAGSDQRVSKEPHAGSSAGARFHCAARTWLDVSTGTGEMAEILSRRADPDTAVVASDFSLPMLRWAARKRAPHSTAAGRILFVAADNLKLPFPEASLDLVTISLGMRNVNTSRDALVSCLREFHRTLKPGGRFVNLETSQPRSRAVRALFRAYVRGFVRPVASILSGNGAAYSYLASSVCSFYEPEELAAIIRESGFSNVKVEKLFLGVAAVHYAEK